MFTHKRLAAVLGLLSIASLVITACGPSATPQTIEVTKIVAAAKAALGQA